MIARRATSALLSLSLSLLAPPLLAFCRTTEPRTPPPYCERGAPVAWPVTCVGLSLNTHDLAASDASSQDLAALLRTHLPRAAAAWSDAPCGPALRLVLAAETTQREGLAFDRRNTVSVNRRWSPDALHLPGVVAITVITTDVTTGALLDADVELDARSPDNPLGHTFGDAAPAWGVVDLPTVLLHELGHVAGLSHSDRDDAVMSASAGDLERQRRALTADDARGVCGSYPVTRAWTRPSPACAPARPEAPPGELTGGMSCAVSHGVRAHPFFVAAIVAAAVRRRRSTKRRHTSMKFASALKALVLGFALLGPVAGCGNENPSTTVTATGRDVRGTVSTRRPVTRVIAVDVKTRRVVASAVPDAQGRFVLSGLRKGSKYKITLVLGRTTKPLLFPRFAGFTGKTNIFGIGTRRCVGGAQCTEGPIDLGQFNDPGPDDTGLIEPSLNPLAQEDFDMDGMPDATDTDVDGDGMTNAMDTDNDGDGMSDNAAFGDSDGDGLTNESDPDVDGDGMDNAVDTDDDGDGMPDMMELAPEGDIDGDGTPNSTDDDADGDGLPNAEDDSPNGEGEPTTAEMP